MYIFFTSIHKDVSMIYNQLFDPSALTGVAYRLIIRLEMMLRGRIVCSGQSYNCILTRHGLEIIFLSVIPFYIGVLGN